MKVKFLGDSKIEKLKNSLVSRSRMSLWMIRAMTILLLWSCFVHLVALGEMWGPRLLKGWPSCFSHHHDDFPIAQEMSSLPIKIALPPKSKHLAFCLCSLISFVYSFSECSVLSILLLLRQADDNHLCSWQGSITTMAILWFLAMEDSTKCEQR